MTTNNTAKVNGSRRGKSSPKANVPKPTTTDNVEASPMTGETTVTADSSEATKGEDMATDNVVQITARPIQADAQAQQGAIALHQSSYSMVWNRPVMPSDIQVSDTITVAGVRPIAASNLQIADSFLNGRPIAASSLKVWEMLPGDRPVFASEIKMVDGIELPGHRPIMASDPILLQGSMLPGNRPIASNEIVDPEPAVLMGYLD